MKVKDVLSKIGPAGPDDCNLCHLHGGAYDIIPNGVECPKCGALTPQVHLPISTDVVGTSNEVIDDDNIEKLPVIKCKNCHNVFALMPVSIIYNANHDIYYTGAREFLIKDFKLDRERIIDLIEQYVRRTKNSEVLTPDHLATWIEGAISKNIAEYFDEVGLTPYLNKHTKSETCKPSK